MFKPKHSLCLLALMALPLGATDPLRPIRTEQAPVIDGILDDLIWKQSSYVTGFKTFTPDYGQAMAEETHAYVAYDRENLYFALRCFDRVPGEIKASIARRDSISGDDWICINLDSFNDHQALYGLYVNPLGIQADTRFANGKEDQGFDMVWYSAGRLDDDGYSIEAQIPLKSIRFSNKEQIEMGVVFERRISRRAEQGTYPPLSAEGGASFLTQMQTLVLNDLEHHTLLEVLPATTYDRRESLNDKGDLAPDSEEKELSLTLKYGLTSKLILDATYNPDFNQVEADAAQVDVNLRSNLFFPEKRSFFLEGNDLFTVAGLGLSNPLREVVHTRNIVDPIMGAKITGKIGIKNTVAALYARDELSDREHADFNILRYKRNMKEDGYLGGFYTDRGQSQNYNRVLGLDGQIRTSPGSIIDYHLLGSRSRSNTLTPSVDGHALAVNFKHSSRNRSLFLTANDISDGFRVESGYISRTGITRFEAFYKPIAYPKSEQVQRLEAQLYSVQTQDKTSNIWETFNHISGLISFWGTSLLKLKYIYATEVFEAQEFQKDGYEVNFRSRLGKKLTYSLNYQDKADIYYDDPEQGQAQLFTANLFYQPSEKWGLDLDYTDYSFKLDSSPNKIFDYPITRARLTYQLNRYLFFRAIAEYKDLKQEIPSFDVEGQPFFEKISTRELLNDLLISFTYIPGTVVHLGYGSFREKPQEADLNNHHGDFQETERKFFFKASYLWRK